MRRLHYFPGFAVPVLGRRAGSLGNFCMGLWLCFPDEKKIGAENKHVTFSGMVICYFSRQKEPSVMAREDQNKPPSCYRAKQPKAR